MVSGDCEDVAIIYMHNISSKYESFKFQNSKKVYVTGTKQLTISIEIINR